MALSIVTANVNGIRAALKRDMESWVSAAAPDIMALQEVRAPDALVRDVIEELCEGGWHVVHSEAAAKGRSGVAVVSRVPIVGTTDAEAAGFSARFWDQGRWVEAEFATAEGTPLSVISSYVHTGDAEDEGRMEEKLAFFDEAVQRIEHLRDTGHHVLWTGDLNIAHAEVDIKNWKGNLKKAGFLPVERERMSDLFGNRGWVDLGRRFGGECPGPYSWWSWRGQAFDNDAGWRIDYLIASDGLAETAKDVVVGRAESYAARWSDHAPVLGTFDLPVLR